MHFFKQFPNLTVLIASFFWGTYWIPLRYINTNSNSSVWPIFISFMILAIVLIKPLITSLKNVISNKNYFFFTSCFFTALAICLYSESLIRGEIARVVILFYLCPIWGTIFAKLFLKQKLTFRRMISISLGFIGLETIVGFDKGIFFPNSVVDWIAIFAGIAWAISMTFFHLSKSTNSLEKTSITSLMIPFIFLFLLFIPHGRSIEISNNLLSLSEVYIWILLFAFIWVLPSILLTYFSVEVLDPGRISILLAFEVVVGIFSASIFTNEIIGTRELIGATFVIAACCIDVFFLKK